MQCTQCWGAPLPQRPYALLASLPLLFGPYIGDSDAAALVGVSTFLFGGIAAIWVVAVSVPASAGLVNFAMTGRFGSMFAFGEIMRRIRSGTSHFFTAWVMSFVIALAASTAASTVAVTAVGSLLAPWVYFAAHMMSAHLFGQWARVAYGVLGSHAAPTEYPPAPPAPPASSGP